MEKGILPVNQITKGLITKILGQYFVEPKVFSFRVVKFGIENQNIIVRVNHSKYVVRIYNQFQFGMYKRTRSSILWELDFMEHVRNQGVPVPKIVATLKHRPLTEINLGSTKYFVLVTEYINGKHVKRLSHQQLKEIIYWQAMLHKCIWGFRSTHKRQHLFQFGFEELVLKKKIDQYPKYKAVLTDLHKMVSELYPRLSQLIKNYKRVPIHNDLNRENFKFVDNRVVGIFDFDDALMGVPIAELGKTLSFVIDKSVSSKQLDRVLTKYLERYHQVVKLNDKDCRLAKLAFLTAWGIRKLFYFQGNRDDVKTSQACLRYCQYLLG